LIAGLEGADDGELYPRICAVGDGSSSTTGGSSKQTYNTDQGLLGCARVKDEAVGYAHFL